MSKPRVYLAPLQRISSHRVASYLRYIPKLEPSRFYHQTNTIHKSYAELILGKTLPKLQKIHYDWTKDIPSNYTFVSPDKIKVLHGLKDFREIVREIEKLLNDKKIIGIDELHDLLTIDEVEKLTLPLGESLQPDEFMEMLREYYKVITNYEIFMLNNVKFQELYIRYAYHLNDLSTISRLLEKYLKDPPQEINDKTIKYLIGAFTYNYELEKAKKIFFDITNLKRDLGTDVLEFTILKFIKSDALFDILIYILQTWIFSRNAVPNAKIMSMVLFESYIYGTLEEIKAMETLVYRYQLNDHYLVWKSRLKFEILSRNKHTKKSLVDEDIKEITKISEKLKALGDMNDLQDFYYSMVRFVSKYCRFQDIEVVINLLKKYNVPITEDFYSRFSSYYVTNGNFLELIDFIETCSTKIEFKIVFLRIIFKSFIKGYPHHASDFQKTLEIWVENGQFTEFQKKFILNSIKVKEMESELVPFVYGDNGINMRKYQLSNWKEISPYKNDKLTRDQHHFRIERGFPEMIERGVKPDFFKILETFKKLSFDNREILIELTHKIRLESKFQDKLSLENLKYATEPELLEFQKYNLGDFNCINQLQFAKILINRKLFPQALEILDNLNNEPEQITDNLRISIFINKLQIFKLQQDFHKFNEVIDTFNSKEIRINPYLIRQCISLNQSLYKFEPPNESLEKLSGFISQITSIMKQDDIYLNHRISQLFDILNNWLMK